VEGARVLRDNSSPTRACVLHPALTRPPAGRHAHGRVREPENRLAEAVSLARAIDLEIVFLFAWAVSVRETGWTGYIEILVFILILLAALFYLWRVGALDWRTGVQRRVLGEMRGAGGVVNRKELEL